MCEKKKVSVGVIVPIYNVEKYLEACLESIANQTIKFDEVILVNDGSKDRSQIICEKYCKKYKYFKLINQKNQGQAAARNNALPYIKSKYVIFIDSDDFIALNAHEVIRRQLEDRKLDILFFSSDVQFDIEMESKRNFYIRSEKLCNKVMSGMDFLKNSFPTNYIVSPCLAAYRKDFLRENEILFPEGHYYEDNFFALQSMYWAQTIMCIQNSLYIRRYRENSTTTSKITSKKIEDIIMIYKIMWQYIAEIIKPKQEKFWKGYISYGVIMIFNMLEKFSDGDLRTKYEKQLVLYFFEYCEYLLRDRNPTIEVYCALLKIYTCILQIGLSLFEVTDTIPRTEKELQEKRNYFKNEIQNIIDHKLEEIKFGNSIQKVAVYGAGKHTECLLKYINQYYGTISYKLCFVVTDGEKLQFMDDKMRNIYIHENEIDMFVVSSMIYQDEMKERLNGQGIGDEKIVLLYDETSVFDLTQIVPIILEQ